MLASPKGNTNANEGIPMQMRESPYLKMTFFGQRQHFMSLSLISHGMQSTFV